MSYDLSDYVDVAERIRIAKELYPELSLQSEWTYEVLDGQLHIIVKAFAYRTPDDQRPGFGLAWEIYPGKTPYTKGSELMVCETSAWGRALAALGIEVRKVASKQEVQAAKSRQEEIPPSRREVKAPVFEAGEPVKGTDVIIKDPTSAPSEKQTMALVNKSTKAGLNSDFQNEFWNFASTGQMGNKNAITKGEASKLIGMDKTDFEGAAADFMGRLFESPQDEAPF
jgi:hypothetical protein